MRNLKGFAAGFAMAAALVTSSAAFAQKSASGSSNGISWTAQSRIIGQTPTSAVLPPNNTIGGGDPLYFAPKPQYNNVVSLIMNTTAGAFICSGTLLSDRRSILTAAHCVSDGAGTANPLSTTAYFSNGNNPNERVHSAGLATAITISDYIVNAGYTGEVIDQNDIAVLRLSSLAPIWAAGHDILTTGDLTGQQFNVAGYGGRSTIGGAFGVDARTGYLRQGDNIFDYAWGNAAFGGFFTDRDVNGENFFGTADVDFSYVSDFDNGLAANDTACRIGQAVGAGPAFCNTGIGAREVNVAGGDSGGPQFINGKLASVTSYGLSFGTGFGDFRAGLNSSWGEFSGYVPTFIHEKFIQSAMVPEPGTWAMLIFGFGLVGGAVRRRKDSIKIVAA